MIISIDLETTPIGPESVIPEFICAGMSVGDLETISTDSVRDVLHENCDKFVFHNAKFDLSVIYKTADEFLKKRILYLVENGMISDTLIREKLYQLSTKGTLHTVRYSLAALTERYLGRVREDKHLATEFSDIRNLPVEEWPAEMVEYVMTDVRDTRAIWIYQEELRQEDGTGSMNTESLQIAADLALQFVTARGMEVDQDALEDLHKRLQTELSYWERQLVDLDMGEYKKDVFKRKTKVFRAYVESLGTHSLTAKGAVAIDKKALEATEQTNTVIAWKEHSKLQKLVTTYLPKLYSPTGVVHPSYDVLKETGRTSSRASNLYPSLNVQNLPRFPGVREMFVPRKGKVFVSIDYSNLELCCAAQVFKNTFGQSSLADAINEGDTPVDMHSRLGAILSKLDGGKKDEKYYRTMAKPINLGYPGGIGPKTIAALAEEQYGVEMSVAEAKNLRDVFFKEYPEIKEYLYQYSYQHKKKNGLFFYETIGRYRNNCTYTSFCNGNAMQSLASDGAKMALWEAFKLDLPMVAFIHDEIIFEFDEGDEESINVAMGVMINSMREVIPDVRITVEAQVMDKWTKEGPFLKEYKKWS